MSTLYHYLIEDQKYIPKLSPFASWPGAMINTKWLKLSRSPRSQKMFEPLKFDC